MYLSIHLEIMTFSYAARENVFIANSYGTNNPIVLGTFVEKPLFPNNLIKSVALCEPI